MSSVLTCRSLTLSPSHFIPLITLHRLVGLQRWEQARDEWLATSSRRHYNHNNTNTNTTTTSSEDDSTSMSTPRAVAVPLDVDEIIDVIFSPRWRGGGVPLTNEAATTTTTVTTSPQQQQQQGETESTTTATDAGSDDLRAPPRRFPTNVPLPQMVDVLVDLWEAEGLDM